MIRNLPTNGRLLRAGILCLAVAGLSACSASFAGDAAATGDLVPTETFIDRALTQYGVGGGGVVIAPQTFDGTGV